MQDGVFGFSKNVSKYSSLGLTGVVVTSRRDKFIVIDGGDVAVVVGTGVGMAR